MGFGKEIIWSLAKDFTIAQDTTIDRKWNLIYVSLGHALGVYLNINTQFFPKNFFKVSCKKYEEEESLRFDDKVMKIVIVINENCPIQVLTRQSEIAAIGLKKCCQSKFGTKLLTTGELYCLSKKYEEAIDATCKTMSKWDPKIKATKYGKYSQYIINFGDFNFDISFCIGSSTGEYYNIIEGSGELSLYRSNVEKMEIKNHLKIEEFSIMVKLC